MERISLIKFESYWNTTFTHYGLTQTTDPVHLKYKKEEATLQTELFDDFVLDNVEAVRVLINSDEDFISLLKGRKLGDEESEMAESKLSKIFNTNS